MPQEPARGFASRSEQDFPLVVANMPATRRHYRIAFYVTALLFVVAGMVVPFAHLQAPRVDSFVPALQTVLALADFITAVLLFAQYAIQPQRALLALASGYLFSGLFAFLQTLAFPGVYAPNGLFGDGTNTSAWFFVLWHTTFPLSVLIYALTKDRDVAPTLFGKSAATSIGITIGIVLAITAVASWLVSAYVAYLPVLYPQSITQQTLFANQINLMLFVWGAIVFVTLFIRRRTVLDLCLMVTLLAWMPNFLVAGFVTAVRFSVGWYVARFYALIASFTLLSVLLTETIFLYSRLANLLTLLRREYGNRLLSVDAATAAMAHEIRQPLGAIALNASAALMYLRGNRPAQDVEAVLSEIGSETDRANATVSAVRDLFGKRPLRKAPTAIEDVVRQVLALVQHELQINQISVVTDFRSNTPLISADPAQLQQVVLNLVKNAIDAMSSGTGPKRLRLATSFDGGSTVVLSVQDSGPGIAKEDQPRVFDTFFTTKPMGMGLGLPICRSIVENHGGDLRLASSDSKGTIFELAWPIVGSPADHERIPPERAFNAAPGGSPGP